VTVASAEALEKALGPRTAMIMVLAAPAADSGPLSTENIVRAARPRGVPVLVDAAAEHLSFPSVHLARGADLVAYSGGKCLRGPQCAGLLLGDKSLIKAAWLHSAPHHAFGRSMKVGKEEIVGMLAAVEMWKRRDHEAEWRTWESWLSYIAARVTKVPGVTTEVLPPHGLSNKAPQLRIRWDGARLGISGEDIERRLFAGDPRIVLGAASGTARSPAASSVTIMPYMMMPGDHREVAEALHAILARPPAREVTPGTGEPAANVAGNWQVTLEFVRGRAVHKLAIEQKGDALTGKHQGDVLAGELRGFVEGKQVRLQSGLRHDTGSLDHDFRGTVAGDTMSGVVTLGEYGEARWSARRA
jgi:L-seryl-tRNA(Ser) seleniumtransferase